MYCYMSYQPDFTDPTTLTGVAEAVRREEEAAIAGLSVEAAESAHSMCARHESGVISSEILSESARNILVAELTTGMIVPDILKERSNRAIGADRLGKAGAIEGALECLTRILASPEPFGFAAQYRDDTYRTPPAPPRRLGHAWGMDSVDTTPMARRTGASRERTPVAIQRFRTKRGVSVSPGEEGSAGDLERKLQNVTATDSGSLIARTMNQAVTRDAENIPIPMTGVNRFTTLLQRALRLMEYYNVSQAECFTYHWEGHAAEMIADNMRRLTAASSTWEGVSEANKEAFIKLGMLCAAYHDAYFTFTRGMGEATCGDMLVRELGLESSFTDPVQEEQRLNLVRMIHLIIEGGTLPVFSPRGERETMHALISKLDRPAEASPGMNALFDVAHTLEKCDVHRTERNELRSAVRVKKFYAVTEPTYSAVKAQLEGLAKAALKTVGLAESAENIESLMDKLGQNLRMIVESKAFKPEEQLSAEEISTAKAYIHAGRKFTPPAEIELSPKIFDRMRGEAAFAGRLANTYVDLDERGAADPATLWQAHAAFMESLAALKNDPQAQKILQYSLQRAGCTDVVVFKEIFLAPDFDAEATLSKVKAHPNSTTDVLFGLAPVPVLVVNPDLQTPRKTCASAFYDRMVACGDAIIDGITGVRQGLRTAAAQVAADRSDAVSIASSTTVSTRGGSTGLTVTTIRVQPKRLDSAEVEGAKPA